MKKVKIGRATITGAIVFFLLIAVVIQVAVLVYAYVAERTESNVAIALIILLIIILLSIICTVADIVRRRLMVDKPVGKILAATSQMTSGDFSVRLEIAHPYNKYNEYDMIMENLNLLAAELQNTELLKTDFISNVSHEIKTPLAILESYSQLLCSDEIDSEERKKYAGTIVQASRRLSDLVGDILRLNKLENQEIQPELGAFSLSSCLEESVLSFDELLNNKNLGVDADIEDMTIYSSQQLVEIVLNNLISNAIKFTDEGGRIGLRLYRQGDNAVIEVSDTGIGISPEVGKHIFDKFYQGDTSHSKQGNGLGLALVKRVIDILGGEISVSSEVGVGSTFKTVLKGVLVEEKESKNVG